MKTFQEGYYQDLSQTLLLKFLHFLLHPDRHCVYDPELDVPKMTISSQEEKKRRDSLTNLLYHNPRESVFIEEEAGDIILQMNRR
ncbi:hypothetical protein ACTXT7_016419 [Hymenolepis weldensis]